MRVGVIAGIILNQLPTDVFFLYSGINKGVRIKRRFEMESNRVLKITDAFRFAAMNHSVREMFPCFTQFLQEPSFPKRSDIKKILLTQ